MENKLLLIGAVGGFLLSVAATLVADMHGVGIGISPPGLLHPGNQVAPGAVLAVEARRARRRGPCGFSVPPWLFFTGGYSPFSSFSRASHLAYSLL